MDANQKKQLQLTACKVRQGIIEGVFNAKSGHPGGSLSITEALTYLYFKEMNIDPQNPKWDKRDRFVLSKGHTAPALYAVLAARGFFGEENLKELRKTGKMLQGHPDMKGTPGVDMTTGSLGQGISAATGMALSAKVFGDSFRVYAALGDGELQEGQVWEAAMFAAHKKLDNLCAIVDFNNLQIDGTLDEVNSPLPINEKWEAFGWHVIDIADGSDFDLLEKAYEEAKTVKGRPTVIISHSIKGKGICFMENKASWHGSAPNAEQYAEAMDELKKAQMAIEEGK